MQINKKSIKRYCAIGLIGTAIITGLNVPNFICNGVNHNETVCPITRVEMKLGLDEAAFIHQKNNAIDDYIGNAQYGTLKKKCIQYDIVDKGNFKDCNLNDGVCYNVSDVGKYQAIKIEVWTEKIGDGILHNGQFVIWKDNNQNETMVKDDNKLLKEYITAINYIGPVEKKYPNSFVLEDRDGNKKRVYSNSEVKFDVLKGLFKTFYYDAFSGYYKIDEKKFLNFIEKSKPSVELKFVNEEAEKKYKEKQAKLKKAKREEAKYKSKYPNYVVPDGYVLGEDGLAHCILTPGYQFQKSDVSLPSEYILPHIYRFESEDGEKKDDISLTRVRKLIIK